MKCILCAQRKGKRYCPAKADMICPTCCGLKRVVEINCPPDCQYLSSGIEFHARATWHKLNRRMDPLKQVKYNRTMKEHRAFLSELEFQIAEEYKSDRTLKDKDLSNGLSLLTKSYETEEKGIIYRFQAQQPEVQQLVKSLQEVIEKQRKPDPEHQPAEKLTLRGIIDCLEAIQETIEFHRTEGVSPTGYLDFTLQLFPEINKEEQSRIVIP